MSAPDPCGPAASESCGTAAPGCPDWSTLDIDLACPRCGYNLRLLPQARCPECGLEFDWAELIAATRQKLSCPLFEYRWRDRPIRSAVLTLWRALWPWRLWRSIPLALPPRVGPLVVLMLIAMVLLYTVIEGIDSLQCYLIVRTWASSRPTPPFYRMVWGLALVHSRPVFGPPLLGLLTFVSLQVFRQTAHRYAVRARHLWRIVLLASIGMAGWQCIVYGVGHLLILRPGPRSVIIGLPLWSVCVPLVAFALSLGFGLTRHLQIRRGWLMALASVIIVQLFLLISIPLHRLLGWDWSFVGNTLRLMYPWLLYMPHWMLD
jgi:hypothetical protein